MILGDGAKVFDLSGEPDALRDRYGRNKFGQSCLMARRLVEKGVPYVTVNCGGWDTHKDHFPAMRRKLPELDKGMATLLQDLSDRGLLDRTIVWWGGEFGRTPKIQWESPWNGGRGHYGKVFCHVVAGGGFKGGRVVGASDDKGEEVKTRPVYPVRSHRQHVRTARHRSRGPAAASAGAGHARDAHRRRGRAHGWTPEGDRVSARHPSQGLMLLWLAIVPVALAQRDPHVGYVYPAGGRQGTTFQAVIGGQYLNNVSNVCVSGETASAPRSSSKSDS